MKHIGCAVAIAVTLAIFGIPLIGTLMFLLVLPGMAVEVAFPIAAIATVGVVTAMGIKSFYSDK